MKPARAVLLLGVLIHLVFLASLFGHWLDPLFLEAGSRSLGQGGDYFGIYQAGDNLTQGRSIYAKAGRPEGDPRRVPYFYFYRYLPPAAYVAALDALLLPPRPAYWAWVALTEALMLLFVLSLRRPSLGPRARREALAGMSLGFFPFYLEQWMGQFSFLMAVFLWWTFLPELQRQGAPLQEDGIRRLSRRTEFWCWSAAIALKNFPALFALPYLRQARWRRVLWAAVLVAAACLPYFLFHPKDISEFLIMNFRPLPPVLLGGSYGLASLMRALVGFVSPPFAGHRFVLGSGDVYGTTLVVSAATAVVVCCSVYATWRMGRQGAAAEALALWTLSFFLIYKDVWEYHYVMLIPVVALLALRGSPGWVLAFGAWLALPTPWILYRHICEGVPVMRWPPALAIAHYAFKTAPVLGLYIVSFARCVRGRPLRKES
jgi:hypothetical protein